MGMNHTTAKMSSPHIFIPIKNKIDIDRCAVIQVRFRKSYDQLTHLIVHSCDLMWPADRGQRKEMHIFAIISRMSMKDHYADVRSSGCPKHSVPGRNSYESDINSH